MGKRGRKPKEIPIKTIDQYMELREIGEFWKERFCRILNEQFSNGWKYIQTIRVGTDDTKNGCPITYAIIFERMEILPFNTTDLIDHTSSCKNVFQLE